MRILVAEDDSGSQKVIALPLRKLGYDVTIAVNGQQAVDSFLSEHFDIIFMDILMPEVDGFEATRLIRESERHTGRRVPIVACTAQAVAGYREICLAAGMDAYMAKPIDRQELAVTVTSFFHIFRAGLEIENSY